MCSEARTLLGTLCIARPPVAAGLRHHPHRATATATALNSELKAHYALLRNLPCFWLCARRRMLPCQSAFPARTAWTGSPQGRARAAACLAERPSSACAHNSPRHEAVCKLPSRTAQKDGLQHNASNTSMKCVCCWCMERGKLSFIVQHQPNCSSTPSRKWCKSAGDAKQNASQTAARFAAPNSPPCTLFFIHVSHAKSNALNPAPAPHRGL